MIRADVTGVPVEPLLAVDEERVHKFAPHALVTFTVAVVREKLKKKSPDLSQDWEKRLYHQTEFDFLGWCYRKI